MANYRYLSLFYRRSSWWYRMVFLPPNPSFRCSLAIVRPIIWLGRIGRRAPGSAKSFIGAFDRFRCRVAGKSSENPLGIFTNFLKGFWLKDSGAARTIRHNRLSGDHERFFCELLAGKLTYYQARQRRHALQRLYQPFQ
jgi:hypothetical protein